MKFKTWLLFTEKIMIQNQEFRDPLPALQHIQNNHPKPENLVVTYTSIDKVGINPSSKYNTPLGIYFYPLNYVVQMKMQVPFAGDKPYINVCEFTRPHKILHMNNNVSDQRYLGMLPLFFPKEKINQATKEVEEKSSEYNIRSNYSNFWFITMHLANLNPTKWNAIFRECGIDGFVDHGTGTIHTNEKTQGVVFEINALKLLHSINNPTLNKKIDNYGVVTYNLKKNKYNFRKMQDEEIIRILQFNKANLDISNLLDNATDKDKIAELIIQHKRELLDHDVAFILLNATDKNKMAKLIINKKPKLSDRDACTLIRYSTETEKIAELIINKQPELFDKNFKDFIISARDRGKMAELIINNKKEFSDENVFNLLNYLYFDYEKYIDHIAELLQKDTDNISKLSVDNIRELFESKSKEYKNKLAQILNTYHQNKTPEIQELIDKYL